MADGTQITPEDPEMALLADIDQTRHQAAIQYIEGIAEPENVAPGEEDNAGVAGRVAKDVGRGLTESGTQILGGVSDAVRAAGELTQAIKGPVFEMGEIDPDTGRPSGISQEKTANDRAQEAGDQFGGAFGVREPKSVTGGLVRGVSQFLTGFVGGTKALNSVRGVATTARAKAGRAVSASVISDFAAFDGHEQRLSDLIQSVPGLQNPVTEFLASDMDDSELEGRLKNVAEGGLSDAALAGMVSALRSMRMARHARDGVGAETYAEASERLARDPEVTRNILPDVSEMRGPDAPLTFRPSDPASQADELRKYLDEVASEGDDGVPSPTAPVSKVETGGDDVYVNWAKIETPDDVRGVIQDLATADKSAIDDARRGVRSNEATERAAGDENAWNLLVERRMGDTLNAEQTLAIRRLWAASGEKLTAAARAMQSSPTPQNTFLFRRAMALHGVVQREVLAVRTETARALQQWSIPAGPDEAVARQVGEALDFFDDADGSSELARRIVGLADAGDQGAIDALSRKSAFTAAYDMVFEYWVNAVLSGPKTHMVNAMSNTAVVLTAQLERFAAAKIGALRGDLDAVDASEAGAMLHGMFASLPDAMRFSWRAMQSGQSGFGMQKLEAPRVRSWSSETLTNTRNETFNKMMNRPLIASGINALGSVITIPGRALGAGDEFFKTINYRMEVHAHAARMANTELRAGKIGPDEVKRRLAELSEDPPDSVITQAREFAQYNTFTNDPGRYAKAITSFKHKAPILRFVMPFVNTPANIIRFIGERTPAAPLLGDVRADIRAGGRRGNLALAKMGLGSFAILTAFDRGLNGQITGAGPSNPREKAALRRTGWQPYSVRIGDRWFAYNRLDPIGGLLGIAANMAEMSMNSEMSPGADYDEAAYGVIGAVGQQMMDRTYLTGLSDLFSAMSEPQRFAPRYFERLAGSFVPAFVREIKSAQDPVLRRTSNTLEEIRSRLPGLSQDLPARHNLWGREISFQSGLGKGFDAVSPIYSSKMDAEPADLAFQEINYFPGLPSANVTVDRETFSLRNQPEAYERYVVLQGGTKANDLPKARTSTGELNATSRRMKGYGDRSLLDTLNAIVTETNDFEAIYDGQSWADGDPFIREQIIKRVIGDFRRAARQQLIAEYPDIFQPGRGRR